MAAAEAMHIKNVANERPNVQLVIVKSMAYLRK